MTLTELLTTAMAPAKSRTARYMVRVDEHLLGINGCAARLAFLKAELSKWQQRYSAWAARIDSGNASDIDLTQTAFDYTETISALAKRISNFEREAV